MISFKNALVYLIHNRNLFLDSCIKHAGVILSDEKYLNLRYKLIFGRKINWNNPITFTEKIQWLKLKDYKDEYTLIVDKYTAKDYVASIIGKSYIIPTIGVWDNVKDIEWEKLPNQFVLKTTHGGGGTGVVICSSRSSFNKEKAISKLNLSMKSNTGKVFREKPYYNIKKRIIAEKYISNGIEELNDYKFFCFNGKVKCFKVDFGRFNKHHANYYDEKCQLLPFGEIGLEPNYNHHISIPANINKMIQIAEKLSQNFRFIRVDLYNINGNILFGEITFYPGSGFIPFTSTEWDYKLGNYLAL